MTIAILKQEAGQAVPRPFARATNVNEMGEVLAGWWRRHGLVAPGPVVAFNCVDTEVPVLVWRGVRFWCFTEGGEQ